jgi:hypothetical protein
MIWGLGDLYFLYLCCEMSDDSESRGFGTEWDTRNDPGISSRRRAGRTNMARSPVIALLPFGPRSSNTSNDKSTILGPVCG